MSKNTKIIVALVSAVAVCALGLVAALALGGGKSADSKTATAKNTSSLVTMTVHEASVKGDKNVDVYFDYSCPHCAELDVAGEELFSKLAKDDSVTYRLIPVNTVAARWNTVATAASLNVYEKDKEHFVAFHNELMKWYKTEVVDAYDYSAAQNESKAREAIIELAKKAGVSDVSIVKNLDLDATDEILESNTEKWFKGVKRADANAVGTPEVTLNGEQIPLTGSTLEEIVANLEKTLLTKTAE